MNRYHSTEFERFFDDVQSATQRIPALTANTTIRFTRDERYPNMWFIPRTNDDGSPFISEL